MGGTIEKAVNSSPRNGFVALIVSESMMTGVVVASIVEQIGLTAKKSHPLHSVEDFEAISPDVIILDGECSSLERRLGIHGTDRPYVISLDERSGPSIVDETIAKPVTAEELHPALVRSRQARALKKSA